MVKNDTTPSSSLAGQLLVAMPRMGDPRFVRTVIYICAHTAEGAMGLVVNRMLGTLGFNDLLEQLNIEPPPDLSETPIHYGGPVESGRGFVLHSADYVRESTLVVDDAMALTATVDILRDIAAGCGPRRYLIALGYAGWGPNQLEEEIVANGWLTVPADDDLIFAAAVDDTWTSSIAKLGINVSMLSGEAGHA